eukprot:4959585-Pyramimonas_sp.AAC.1
MAGVGASSEFVSAPSSAPSLLPWGELLGTSPIPSCPSHSSSSAAHVLPIPSSNVLPRTSFLPPAPPLLPDAMLIAPGGAR